jgi:hypothetical protein
MRPFIGGGLDDNLGARAYGPALNQLKLGQHGAGGGQLCSRQVDLDVQEQVGIIGAAPRVLQRAIDICGDAVQAAAVKMVGQRGNIDANGGAMVISLCSLSDWQRRQGMRPRPNSGQRAWQGCSEPSARGFGSFCLISLT